MLHAQSTPALSLAPQQLDVETTASPAAMLIMVTGACTLQARFRFATSVRALCLPRP